MLYLIILFAIFYGILAYLRPQWAVMVILAALPSYLIRFSIKEIPFTLLEVMILISFAIWFIFKTEFRNFIRGKYGWKNYKENRRTRIAYPFGMELILMLIVSFVAAGIAGFSDSALGIWKAYFFEPALFYILILNVFTDAKRNDIEGDLNQALRASSLSGVWEKILWPLAVSAFAVSALSFYQWATGDLIFNEFWANPEERRIVSFFGYPNSVSLFLGPIIMLMVGWFLSISPAGIRREQIKKSFIFITIIISLFSIYFAKSKGALIALSISFLIFFLFSAPKKMKWSALSLIIIAVIVLTAIIPARDLFMDKIVYGKSMQIREQQWKETWAMLKNNKYISGAGLSNYQNAVKAYHQEGIFLRNYKDPDWHKKTVFNAEYRASVWQPTEIYLYPHNIFFNFWSELGLAGVLLFTWIIWKSFNVNVRNLKFVTNDLGDKKRQYLVLGIICAMIVVILHGLVDVPYFKNDLAILFWVIIAMTSLIHITHNTQHIT